MSVDLTGARAVLSGATRYVELGLRLKQTVSALERLEIGDVRLHCMPVTNLFEVPARPFRLLSGRRSYPLACAETRERGIHAVSRVAAVLLESGELQPVKSLSDGPSGVASVSDPAFQVVRRPSLVSGSSGDDVSLEVFGLDRLMAIGAVEVRAHVGAADHDCAARMDGGELSWSSPLPIGVASFRGLTQLGQAIEAAIRGDVQWRMLRSATTPLGALLERARLVELLRLLEGDAGESEVAPGERGVAAKVSDVTVSRAQRSRPGGVEGELRVALRVAPSAFGGEGEVITWSNLVADIIAAKESHHAAVSVSVQSDSDGGRSFGVFLRRGARVPI